MIAYLDEYRAMLDHQRRHPGTLLRLTGQPDQYCYHCLRDSPVRAPEDAWGKPLQRRYSWAVPNEAALQAIADHSPNGVVEIGAGGGYWSMLLRERGVDVMAYDPNPPGGDLTDWHTGPGWTEVLQGDHTRVVDHPDRTLLLCWPSYGLSWTHEVVQLFAGDTVVYIGEGMGGCTGTDLMHTLLGDGTSCWHDEDEGCDCAIVDALFKPVATVKIPQWAGLHDRLTAHKRL